MRHNSDTKKLVAHDNHVNSLASVVEIFYNPGRLRIPPANRYCCLKPSKNLNAYACYRGRQTQAVAILWFRLGSHGHLFLGEPGLSAETDGRAATLQ